MPSTPFRGGADLVAHVGQELALGAACRLGLLFGRAKLQDDLFQLGIGLPKLFGALGHQFLQVHPVSFQFHVALLDLSQHFVETIHQSPQSSSLSFLP